MKITRTRNRVVIDLTELEASALSTLLAEGAEGLVTAGFEGGYWDSEEQFLAGSKIDQANRYGMFDVSPDGKLHYDTR